MVPEGAADTTTGTTALARVDGREGYWQMPLGHLVKVHMLSAVTFSIRQ